VILEIILPLAGVMLAGICWPFASRALAGRRRRLNLLAIELRLTDALEMFDQEVFKLKHYRVLRPGSSGANPGLIPSTNTSSLRYMRGRQNDD
jgi:hypothetical protein